MKQKVTEKLQAITLRKQGYTVNEIAMRLVVSKGSVSTWVRNVPLSKQGEVALLKKIRAGQFAGAQSRRNHTHMIEQQYFASASQTHTNTSFTQHHIRLLCALIYWCEGSKGTDRVDFTNADPKLVKLFLHYLRSGFSIDEQKFRVCIHLHTYHDKDIQTTFWSQVTNIPQKQFIKPHQKLHTGKQIREGYQGCISIRYHNADIARQLHTLAKAAFTLTN